MAARKDPAGPGSDGIVKPIKWSNLLEWARWTASADLVKYRKKKRALSVGRLLGGVMPELKKPVFLIGAERSGTTFLGECLAALSELSYHYEPVATKAAAEYIYRGLWSFEKAKKFYRRVYAWLMRIHLDGDLRFAEKTPRNCFLVGFLHHAFPGARFIHIIRDGRDAALSLSKKPWLLAESSRVMGFDGHLEGAVARFWVEEERKDEFEKTSDIHRCIWSWRRHTESALAHAEALPPWQYHELRYENLVKDPRLEAERLLDYLEIGNPAQRALFHDVISRAHPKSVGRWKRELAPRDYALIEKEAGGLMRELGYARE